MAAKETLLKLLGWGSANRAGKLLAGRRQQLEAQERQAMGEEPSDSSSDMSDDEYRKGKHQPYAGSYLDKE